MPRTSTGWQTYPDAVKPPSVGNRRMAEGTGHLGHARTGRFSAIALFRSMGMTFWQPQAKAEPAQDRLHPVYSLAIRACPVAQRLLLPGWSR